jgi:hypothetical protein
MGSSSLPETPHSIILLYRSLFGQSNTDGTQIVVSSIRKLS